MRAINLLGVAEGHAGTGGHVLNPLQLPSQHHAEQPNACVHSNVSLVHIPSQQRNGRLLGHAKLVQSSKVAVHDPSGQLKKRMNEDHEKKNEIRDWAINGTGVKGLKSRRRSNADSVCEDVIV